MKTQIRFFMALYVMMCISCPVIAFSHNISFTGSGASSTIDSVVVQNLYKGTKVTVEGGSQLRLSDDESAIGNLNIIADFANVYPNPIIDNAMYSFVVKNDGNTQVSVFGLDGKKVTGIDINLSQGKHSFQLTLPKGVYLIQAKGKDFSYTTKIISFSMTDHQPQISYRGNMTNNKPQKVGAPEVKLQYTTGDQLLYKAYSGNYCTIVTDKPTETKTTDFKFVECTDADGNHYAVVHIGNQTWMAENLKTTKYRNGEAIPNVTENAAWAALSTSAWCDYDNNAANGLKYGKLYNWYAVADGRNIAPSGWHGVTNEDWIVLENHLISNGYNYDGTTTENKIAKALAANVDWEIFSEIGTVGNDLKINNKVGFSLLPGGYRFNDGLFFVINYNGTWWSSTEADEEWAWVRNLSYNHYSLGRGHNKKICGFSLRCIKDELPTLTTSIITNIDNTTAISGGTITSIGSSNVKERGVCWSKNPHPTVADSKTSDGSGNGSFISNLSGLTSGETYYLRAYATNNEGSAYGNEVNFKTTIQDIDGNIYTSITIGTQKWMVENLKTTKYRNGEEIVTTTLANKDISSETEPKYQWDYFGIESNVEIKYGKLYTWYAVADSRNIAPAGWHVPTDDEWIVFENFLINNGYNFDGTTTGDKTAKALAATTDWFTYSVTGTIGNDLSKNNNSGFAALPGGYRYKDGTYGSFKYAGNWWSAVESSNSNAWSRFLNYNSATLDRSNYNKYYGFSVRCVRDE